MLGVKGFSLIETLVCIAIFALVAAAVGSLLSTSFLAEGWNANQAVAVTVAQQELEHRRSLSYADVQSGVATYVQRGRTFTVTTIVREDQPAANMKEITATVTWDDARQSRSYATQTIFTNIQR
jgi:prepilin-type N-terminal cleavage/methylation domain-containing protein